MQNQPKNKTFFSFQCDLCPASFKANNALHMHKRACHSTTWHACKLCARVLSSSVYLARHMRGVHANAAPKVDPVTNTPHMKTVVTNVSPVETVVTNVSPVETVVTKVSPVETVVTNVSPVKTVVTNVSPVETVVTNVSPVETVVTNVSPVETDVTNMSPVKNVPNVSAVIPLLLLNK